ncbi:MAG: hypothetical protein QM791_21405 [Ferruginibacter sp.]
MKKIYFILAIILSSFAAQAQAPQEDQLQDKKQQDIEALKVAFISKELQLTPEEAQQFWPVYNQYSGELKNTISDETDIIERDQKIVDLRKRYKDRFIKILGQQRMNRLFGAEADFRRLLIKAIRKQKQLRQNNRPLLRKGF